MAARHLLSRAGLPVLAACLFVVTAACPGRADDKPATTTYEVDTKDSRIFVKVDKTTRLGHLHGVEGNFKSGKLTFGGEGELVFDMASFTADTEEARRRVGLGDKPVSENEAKDVTDAMRGAKVLDVAQYPTATCRLTAITPQDKQAAGEAGTYLLEGRLALHGAEQKIQFKAKLEPGEKKGTLRMTGVFTVKQTDFGIKPVVAAGGFAKVADEIDIHGDLRLVPAAAK
jgi:polyisoprenoid-binding protein YceI